MNALVQTAETRRRNEGLAFLSLAKTQRRLAGEYRKWAREAEAAGKTEQFNKYAAEARRLWRDTKWHLQTARRYLNG